MSIYAVVLGFVADCIYYKTLNKNACDKLTIASIYGSSKCLLPHEHPGSKFMRKCGSICYHEFRALRKTDLTPDIPSSRRFSPRRMGWLRGVELVERRLAPRRGFRGECCLKTALHRLCRQWHGTLDACGRCLQVVNSIRNNKHRQLREVWR